jgi:hypothetical protein
MNEKTERKGREKKKKRKKEKGKKKQKINVLHFKRAFPLIKSIF